MKSADLKVASITKLYNLEVEEFHNYFADDILVHNLKCQQSGCQII